MSRLPNLAENRRPHGQPATDGQHHLSVVAPDDHAETILARLLAVRRHSEALAAPLSPEDQCVQSMADASPTKWHLAHTSWFFESFVLQPHVAGYRPFSEAYGFLFNSYYEAMGPRHARPQRGLLTRPSAAEITAYRRHVDDALVAAFRGDPDHAAAVLAPLVELGWQHEQQHQELLLTDILHAFHGNPLQPAYDGPGAPRPRGAGEGAGDADYDGGLVSVGHDGQGFAFDNEGPRHQVFLRPYRLARGLVTNREWLEFMAAGGYRDPAHWLADGWARVVQEQWQAPLYWRHDAAGWSQLTLAGRVPLDLDAPVTQLSFFEAEAFARWRGKRLPTEAEWEHAALLAPLPQMFGEAWQWTASAYAPYPGFRALPGALGEYNGKFMSGQMVLKGSSCVTPRGHARASYRNFFYPHQRWQFAGLRLADEAPPRAAARVADGGADPDFLASVLDGLSRPQKTLEPKYFYDDEGGRLFDRICDLAEYYPPRVEAALLRRLCPDLDQVMTPDSVLVELGSGASIKTRLLLDRLTKVTSYIPVDINAGQLQAVAKALAADYPALEIAPLCGDMTAVEELPPAYAGRPKLGFFPGSTIGNFQPTQAVALLERIRRLVGPGGRLLIGIDLVKPLDQLLPAYDDAEGVTAAFNRNLLTRINRELKGDFAVDSFAHEARWNAADSRIEMHLVSRRPQHVAIAGRVFSFARGESIHTENSHKFTVGGFAALAAKAGWTMTHDWVSEAPAFAVIGLRG